MYRVGSLRRVFRARGKLVGTSDFVVTRGYVQIRVVGFPWETASLEAVVRLPRTVNGTGHTGPSEFCATSI